MIVYVSMFMLTAVSRVCVAYRYAMCVLCGCVDVDVGVFWCEWVMMGVVVWNEGVCELLY